MREARVAMARWGGGGEWGLGPKRVGWPLLTAMREKQSTRANMQMGIGGNSWKFPC